MKNIFCPECEYPVKLGLHPHKGQRVVCTTCQAKLIVVSMIPMELEVDVSTKLTAEGKSKTVQADCPQCGEFIRLSVHIRQGQQVICSSCQNTLEVVNTNPIELDMAIMAKMKQRQPKQSPQKKIKKRN
jgi:lysine biosynthesis protein LysW